MDRSVAHRIALALLIVAFAIDVTSMWRMSQTYDEGGHLQFGTNVLTKADLTAWNQSMPVSALNALPVVTARHFGVALSPRAELMLARLPTVCFSLLLGALVYLWSSELFGVVGGLISLGLYVFDPNIIAHSRLVTTDLPCALSMMAAVYLFVRCLKSPSTGNVAAAALATGLAQLTKQTALLLFPVFLVLVVLKILGQRRTAAANPPAMRVGARRAAVHGILFSAIVLAVLNAGYGFRTSMTTGQTLPIISFSPTRGQYETVVRSFPNLPIPLPTAYVESLIIGSYYNESGRGHGPNYLLGQRSQMGWWYYFPVALSLKAPLALFIAVAISVVLWTRAAGRGWIDEAAMVLSVGSVFLFFTFFCTVQIGIRYVLPMFPFLCVFCGRLGTVFTLPHARVFRIATAAVLSWFVVSSVSYHPYYLSYFNEAIGSRKSMYKYLADSNVDWGQNDYVLARYIAARPRDSISVNPPHPVTGTVIVNVNRLVGLEDSTEYAWLRKSFEPADHVGYSWLIYRVPRGDAR